MRKRLLLTVWLLCGLTMLSWGQADGKKEAKLLVDGCFFTEPLLELQGATYQMSILKNDNGRMMLLVTGTSQQKRDELLEAIRQVSGEKQ